DCSTDAMEETEPLASAANRNAAFGIRRQISTNELNRGIKSWLNNETSDESSGFIVLAPLVMMFLRTNNDLEFNIEEL
ncbi:26103_t:CDS:2, partial [Gigaspora rosea]